MSFFEPEEAKKKYYIFGKGGGKYLSKEYEMELLSEIPLVEKKESIILYDLETYKKVFGSERVNLSIKSIFPRSERFSSRNSCQTSTLCHTIPVEE